MVKVLIQKWYTIQGTTQNLTNPTKPRVAIRIGKITAAPIITTKAENFTSSLVLPSGNLQQSTLTGANSLKAKPETM